MRYVARALGARARWIAVAVACAVVGSGYASYSHAQAAVCAEVKIEIKQKLSLERQAFDAVMRINNGLQTDAIGSVGVNLTFQDQAGNAVVATSDPNNTSASFFVRIDSLGGISAIDGSGSVAPRTTGEVHWLIIPAPGSGGTQPQGKLYFVGAELTYSLLNDTKTVTVTPDTITVKPQPLLALDYFLAGDVYADDPFTPQVEPPVPFTLGVRIKNVGGGSAANTSIESAQPKIVDNKQGLLIGFQIQDSYVNDQPAQKTLLLNFGDVGPGAATVGRWIMTTTLSGRFVDLQASYTHADSLGGALTSLIKGVTTHLLVHDVKVDLLGRDNVRDFLALDGDVLRVYESEGSDTPVTDQSASGQLRASSGGNYSLTFQPTTGFAYAKLTDPFRGQSQPGPVVRSDGKALPPENAWLSKTRNQDLTWSYFINIFDVNTTGSYTVGFTASGGASISGFVYVDANNNGQKDSGESGVGAVAVTLAGIDDQGASVNTVGYTNPDGSYSFVQLRPGTYSLKVAAVSGLVDGILKVGSAGGAAAGDTISGIVLASGGNASGYLFAKRSGPPPAQADLSLTMTASATQVAVGTSVTFTITTANAGPSTATSAKVTDILPAGLAFVGATTTAGGGYDSSTGTWAIGDLASGASATLALMAKVNSTNAPIVDTATISSVVVDPNPANNKVSVTLNPDAGSLKVTQSVLPDARVLVLVSCPTASGQDDPACVAIHSSFVSSYLGALGLDVKAVADTNSFRTAFRSGRYNTYWVSGGAAKLTGTLAQEVREATFRGDDLIVDGAHNANSSVFDEAAGATLATGVIGSGQQIALEGTTATVATVGDAVPLTLTTGEAQATFVSPGSPPAIVTNTYGQGKALVAAFDLIGTLQQPTSEQALHSFLAQFLEGIAAPPDPVVGAAYVPIGTTVENTISDTTVDVSTALPTGVSIVNATPTPTSTSSSRVSWRFALPAGQTMFIDLGLRVPTTSGQYSLQTTVSKFDGNVSTLYGNYAMPLNVFASDQFGPQLVTDLGGLTLTNPAEQQARNQALAALQAGQTKFAANRFEDAIAQFIAAGDSLDLITSLDLGSREVTVDKWLQESELRWYLLPVAPGCRVNVTQQVTVKSGGFTLNRATGRFTQQVTVTALQPVSGPVMLQVINLSPNATLYQSSSTTTDCNPPAASPLVTLSTIDLAAGTTASVVLEFVNPTRQPITYSTQVLSGSGSSSSGASTAQ